MNPEPSGFGPFRNPLSVLLVVVRGWKSMMVWQWERRRMVSM